MTPVRYADDVEKVEADEGETASGLIEQAKKISGITFKDEGHAIRSVHAKSHALLDGELTVLGGLAPELAQGLFAKPATYKVALRLSTSPGDMLPDSVSTPRGMAVKVFGVSGEQLSANPGDSTQDFLMVDAPAFLAPNPKAFLANVKLLAATTDKVEGLKVAFSTVLRGIEGAIEAAGGHSGTLVALGGHPATNPLGETYFSQVPIRYGDYVAKVRAVPVGAIAALKGVHIDVGAREDALRAAVGEHFAGGGAEWEVQVQLCRDLEKMPVETASTEWPEDLSPYVTVARLTASAQPSWSLDQKDAIDDGMAFSPWHGLVAHRPLGGIMRARKPVYAALQSERSARSGCPFHQGAPHAAG